MRIQPMSPGEARRQATWLIAQEPWKSLGYDARRLGAWLAESARKGRVTMTQRRGEPAGLVVVQPDVLLGDFIALLAVRPEAAGRGIGSALIESAARRTFRQRRWLYVSSDAANRGAGAFYRKLGFEAVGRLPDLIAPGRAEILWRRARPAPVADRRARARVIRGRQRRKSPRPN
jgi:ribosomal protein S18 acetylase RimI-like enzyme